MQRLMACLGYVFIAGVVSVASSAVWSTPVLAAQHGEEHGGDHGGASSNAIDARADSGVVSLESVRFT